MKAEQKLSSEEWACEICAYRYNCPLHLDYLGDYCEYYVFDTTDDDVLQLVAKKERERG